MSINSSSPKINAKPARRRHVRAEQIAITIERVEYLAVEVKNAAAVSQLIDGLERRLAIVEDEMPAAGGLTAQPDMFKSNGAAHR